MNRQEGLRDLMFLAGMVCLAVGLAMWSVPLMFTVIGGVLMALALGAAWRGSR